MASQRLIDFSTKMVTPVMEAQSQKNWAAIRPGALCVCATQPRARQDVALISEGHSAVNDSCESENIFESDYLPGSASDTAENSDGDKSFYPLSTDGPETST